MPKTNNPYSSFFAQNNFSKLFEGYNSSTIDVKSFLETQRKNLLAISEAQQTTIEGYQAITQRQTELLSQLIENNSSIAKQALKEGSPEEKIAQNADIFKEAYESSINNLQELTNMAQKTTQEAGNILNKRVTASASELKSAIKKQSKAA